LNNQKYSCDFTQFEVNTTHAIFSVSRPKMFDQRLTLKYVSTVNHFFSARSCLDEVISSVVSPTEILSLEIKTTASKQSIKISRENKTALFLQHHRQDQANAEWEAKHNGNCSAEEAEEFGEKMLARNKARLDSYRKRMLLSDNNVQLLKQQVFDLESELLFNQIDQFNKIHNVRVLEEAQLELRHELQNMERRVQQLSKKNEIRAARRARRAQTKGKSTGGDDLELLQLATNYAALANINTKTKPTRYKKTSHLSAWTDNTLPSRATDTSFAWALYNDLNRVIMQSNGTIRKMIEVFVQQPTLQDGYNQVIDHVMSVLEHVGHPDEVEQTQKQQKVVDCTNKCACENKSDESDEKQSDVLSIKKNKEYMKTLLASATLPPLVSFNDYFMYLVVQLKQKPVRYELDGSTIKKNQEQKEKENEKQTKAHVEIEVITRVPGDVINAPGGLLMTAKKMLGLQPQKVDTHKYSPLPQKEKEEQFDDKNNLKIKTMVEVGKKLQPVILYQLCESESGVPCVVRKLKYPHGQIVADSKMAKERISHGVVTSIRTVRLSVDATSIVYTDDFAIQACPYCKQNRPQYLLLPCRHNACSICFLRVLRGQLNCPEPTCRQPIKRLFSLLDEKPSFDISYLLRHEYQRLRDYLSGVPPQIAAKLTTPHAPTPASTTWEDYFAAPVSSFSSAPAVVSSSSSSSVELGAMKSSHAQVASSSSSAVVSQSMAAWVSSSASAMTSAVTHSSTHAHAAGTVFANPMAHEMHQSLTRAFTFICDKTESATMYELNKEFKCGNFCSDKSVSCGAGSYGLRDVQGLVPWFGFHSSQIDAKLKEESVGLHIANLQKMQQITDEKDNAVQPVAAASCSSSFPNQSNLGLHKTAKKSKSDDVSYV
jgi:hypothetical protein